MGMKKLHGKGQPSWEGIICLGKNNVYEKE